MVLKKDFLLRFYFIDLFLKKTLPPSTLKYRVDNYKKKQDFFCLIAFDLSSSFLKICCTPLCNSSNILINLV